MEPLEVNVCWIALIMSHPELRCSDLITFYCYKYAPFPLGCSNLAFKLSSAESQLYPLRCFQLN